MKKYILSLIILSFVSIYGQCKTCIRLDETTISTGGFETKVKDETKNILIIGKQDIQKKSYTSVEDILKDSPYIQTINNEYGTLFDLRGQGARASNRVKILVDGIPVNMMNMLYGTESSFPLNNIPVTQIERIEIVPGGGVLYGNGTSGGFINIVTKNKIENYAVVEGKYGSFNNKNISVGTGIKITNNLGANINYQGVRNNGYRDDEYTDGDNLGGGLIWKIAKNHILSLKAEKYKENYKKTGTITYEQIINDRRGKPEFNYREGTQKKNNYLLNYIGSIKHFDISANIFNQISKDNQLQSVYEMGNQNLTKFRTREEKTGINFNGKYNYTKGTIIFGYEFLREKAKSSGIGDMGGNKYNVSKNTNSIYALNKFYITQKLQFNVGIRGEYSKYDLKSINKTGAILEKNKNINNYAYESSLNYLYSETGNTYIKYERGFSSPTPIQLFDKHLIRKEIYKKPETYYTINNLKTEKTDTFEIGMKDIIDNVYFSMTGYYSQTKDEIVKNTGIHAMVGPIWTYENYPETKRYGFEFYSEQYFGKLTLNQSLAYVDAEVSKGKNKGDEIPLVSKYRSTLGLTYNFNEKLIGNLIVNIYSKYYNGKTTAIYKPNGKISKKPRDKGYRPNYITTDISLKYRFDGGLTLITGINNLFNEQYYLYDDEGYEIKKGMPPKYNRVGAYIPAPERNYYIGFRYEI